MKNTKLSLADFKAKAENVNTNEVLEKVQGGDWGDCHGFWGQAAKGFDNWVAGNMNDPLFNP
jgi:hypothetical protein|tara:strand:+ start:142 stop:327 length:186 start_codon:yes stop_codon:yes gene_type:complete